MILLQALGQCNPGELSNLEDNPAPAQAMSPPHPAEVLECKVQMCPDLVKKGTLTHTHIYQLLLLLLLYSFSLVFIFIFSQFSTEVDSLCIYVIINPCHLWPIFWTLPSCLMVTPYILINAFLNLDLPVMLTGLLNTPLWVYSYWSFLSLEDFWNWPLVNFFCYVFPFSGFQCSFFSYYVGMFLLVFPSSHRLPRPIPGS